MARIAWLGQQASFQCGTATIVAHTSKPTHVWLGLSTKKPSTNPRYDRDIVQQVPHAWQFDFTVQYQLEQDEPGDTLLHTFRFSWPSTTDEIWTIATNDITDPPNSSLSPIYAYNLIIPPAWYTESWDYPQGSLGPWQLNETGAHNSIDISHGEAVLTSMNGGIGISRNLPLPPGVSSLPACLSTFWSPELDQIQSSTLSQVTLTISFQLDNPPETFTTFVIINTMRKPNDINPSFYYFCDSGRIDARRPHFPTLLMPAMNIAQYYGTVPYGPIDPIRNPRMTRIAIGLGSGVNPTEGPDIAKFTPFSLSLGDPTLKDVSNSWRTISPIETVGWHL